jgi:hypothetical protein
MPTNDALFSSTGIICSVTGIAFHRLFDAKTMIANEKAIPADEKHSYSHTATASQ